MAASFELVEQKLQLLRTQYRESPNLKFLIGNYLEQLEQAYNAICVIPEFFDLNTAVGDQLTILGRRAGFGRTHCVCTTQPVYEFDCITGESNFCNESAGWSDCVNNGISSITITNDDIYRRILRARAYQRRGLFDFESLCAAVQALYGDTASVINSGNYRVTITLGRELTDEELTLIQIMPRVLPVAPSVQIAFHFGSTDNILGFGEGYVGFCESQIFQSISLIADTGEIVLTDTGDELITNDQTSFQITNVMIDTEEVINDMGDVVIADNGDQLITQETITTGDPSPGVEPQFLCEKTINLYNCE